MSNESDEQTALNALNESFIRNGACCPDCIERVYGPLLAAYRAAILRTARAQQRGSAS
jgi:hypothetical protein